MLHRHLNRTVDKFPCRECDVSFKSCDDFTSHLRRVHNDFRFVCHICAKMFKLKGSLLVHQRVVHQSADGEGHHCKGLDAFLPFLPLMNHLGATLHRGSSILASHPAAPSLILSVPKNFSLDVVEIY